MARTGIPELTAFIAIAEQRSFRGAARVLEVTPSALSHAMRGLEARIGVRLFNRTTRSVALTGQGEQLLRRVRPAMADLDDAIKEVASARDRPSGAIRISTPHTGAAPLVRHVLPGFLAAYPDIKVEFVVDGRFVDIVADGFDAGIRLLEAVPRDMVAIRFGEDMRMIPTASPAYLARHGTPKTPNDLLRHRCIRHRFDSGAIYRWELERRGKNLKLDVPGQLTLGDIKLMIEAAVAGVAISLLPVNLVAEELADGRLVNVLSEWCPPFPGFCLYYPANRHPPAALRLFAQAVREWAGATPPRKAPPPVRRARRPGRSPLKA
ncbi:MAG: LysR family transcriptional regulator [Candidatus Binatia bacterium]